jgi:hypothetical protein
MPPQASLETRKKIYQSLCYVLSDRADQIGWDEFTPADWELFSQMAGREGVAPLMYWKLRDTPVAVPPSTFSLLRSTYYQTLAQNTLMYQELDRILKALDEAGIPVIVLKGAALAATLYEDIGLRPMGDLDLLVREEKLQEALEVMRSIGYIEEPMPHQEFNREVGYDIHLWREANQDLKVELHWGLVAGEDVWHETKVKGLWEEARRWSPSSDGLLSRDFDNVLQLSPEASLVYLSAHLIMHHGMRQSRLLWFLDIYLLISKDNETLDRAKLDEQTYQFRWTLLTVLVQIHQLFGMPPPSEIAPTIFRQEMLLPNSDHLVRQKALRNRTKATEVWAFFLLLSYWDRVRYALRMIFPSPIFIQWRYEPDPYWLWPLFYPYRWVRIVREAIMTISKMVCAIRG